MRPTLSQFISSTNADLRSMTKLYDMLKDDMFNGVPSFLWSLVPATEDGTYIHYCSSVAR